MPKLSNILREEFKDKEYREAYIDEHRRTLIAMQIKTMRESEGWT